MHCSKKKTVSLCINIIIPPFLFLSTILQAGCPPPPSRCTFWRKYFLYGVLFFLAQRHSINYLFRPNHWDSLRFVKYKKLSLTIFLKNMNAPSKMISTNCFQKGTRQDSRTSDTFYKILAIQLYLGH